MYRRQVYFGNPRSQVSATNRRHDDGGPARASSNTAPLPLILNAAREKRRQLDEAKRISDGLRALAVRNRIVGEVLADVVVSYVAGLVLYFCVEAPMLGLQSIAFARLGAQLHLTPLGSTTVNKTPGSAEKVSSEKVSAEKVSAEKVSAEKVSAEKVSAEPAKGKAQGAVENADEEKDAATMTLTSTSNT